MIKRRRKDKIRNVSEVQKEESTPVINGRQQLLKRLQRYNKYDQIKIYAENKANRREERINAEIADQKRQLDYLAAVEKVLERDKDR